LQELSERPARDGKDRHWVVETNRRHASSMRRARGHALRVSSRGQVPVTLTRVARAVDAGSAGFARWSALNHNARPFAWSFLFCFLLFPSASPTNRGWVFGQGSGMIGNGRVRPVLFRNQSSRPSL
jgi:hypothetical protein